jgi:hypothetical protein
VGKGEEGTRLPRVCRTLPRSVTPRASARTWNVTVALRQWNRVQDSLAGYPDDELISEGSPVMQGTPHVLRAQSGTRVALLRAQHQAQHPPETPAPEPAQVHTMGLGFSRSIVEETQRWQP